MQFNNRYKTKKQQLKFSDKSLTQQSFKDETNVNKIVAKAARTGMLPNVKSDQAQYGDFAQVPDYLEAMSIIHEAQDRFSALDSTLRKRFDNDPAQFLQFVADESNLEEMRTLGLAEPLPLKQQETAPAVDTSPTGDISGNAAGNEAGQ